MVLTLSESASDCPVAKIECFIPAEGSYYNVLQLVVAGKPGISSKMAQSTPECRMCILTLDRQCQFIHWLRAEVITDFSAVT